MKCNSNKQLFKYSFGSSCNPSSLKWSPEEILIDCVDSVAMPASGECPHPTIPQPSLINFNNPAKPCVKCPRGMKFDMTQKDCLACPIGYTSEQESNLNCTKCPEKKAPERRGRKHAKIFVIKGCHQEMGSILLTNMRVIFATLDSNKINMVPHSVSNARMDSQQLRRDQPPWMTVE